MEEMVKSAAELIDSVGEKNVMVKPKKQQKKDTQWEKDHKMVRGIFKNFELPGAPLTFMFCKYKGDPIKKYTLRDGETAEIPYMVVRHINDNCRYPQYAFTEQNQSLETWEAGMRKVSKWIQRYGFYSTDFEHNESPAPSLIRVETV